MTEIVKIFYAHSTHEDNQYSLYNGISKRIKESNQNIKIMDCEDESGTFKINDVIYKNMDDSDIAIIDITPEEIKEIKIEEKINKSYVFNPNVMCELGYLLKSKLPKQIIIIYNKKNIKPEEMPFNIKTLNMHPYEILLSEDIEKEIDHWCSDESELMVLVKNINEEPQKDWKSVDYKLSNKFQSQISLLLDVQYKGYIIRINKKIKQAVILLSTNGYTRKINILKKELIMLKKDIDLAEFYDIYKELQHLETIAYLNWFN